MDALIAIVVVIVLAAVIRRLPGYQDRAAV